jgi:hypothetical protein
MSTCSLASWSRQLAPVRRLTLQIAADARAGTEDGWPLLGRFKANKLTMQLALKNQISHLP